MTTSEGELTEPVDLCVPDGSALNPAAKGWSRTPLHRANLDGNFGRNKRWDYWAILAGDLVVTSVFTNTDKLGVADVSWLDVPTGTTGGHLVAEPPGDEFVLPEHPGTAPLTIERDDFSLAITDNAEGTHLVATWTEADGRPGRLDVTVALPEWHESLNVVIPWDDTTFNFTSKHQARPATGELVVGDDHRTIGGAGGAAWGVLDVGRGRWPSDVDWNWGGGAGRSEGHVVGLQFGAKWTQGSGFTENGIIVDGRLSKIGRELDWIYDWDAPMGPWRVVDPDGQLDVTLTPRYDRHSRLGRRRISETHQVFGTWSGRVRTDDGVEVTFDDLQGFAEEARQRW
ncbi:MAG TPA: DUF2804 domain-containing protein [Acidimicrobiales bacterium]|nr:DUF2804 domain-containing protein [Acidimicrobiales bacterium]